MACRALEGIVPANRVAAMLERLNTASRLSDWGQRGMSFEDPRYVEGSYGLGSVWPVQTMGPMLANFRFHNAVQGFQTWMSDDAGANAERARSNAGSDVGDDVPPARQRRAAPAVL